MVKKHGLWYAIKYYALIQHLLFAVALYFVNPYALQLFCKLTNVTERSMFYKIYIYLVPIALAALWIYVFFTVTRDKSYRYQTNRSYGYDHSHYQRSYYDLIDYFKDADPYQMNTDKLTTKSWKNCEGMILGKTKNGKLLNIESGADGRNYFIFGLPSTGKTAGPIICSCLRFGMDHPLAANNKKTFGSVFCIDLKNDIWKATHKYRRIKRFNLMEPEHSTHFNPFAGIEKLSIDERCNFIENIGFNIIPAATGGSGDGKYFSDTAYDFWNGIALYLLHKDINTSFPDVIKAILAGNAVDWVKEVCASDCEEAKRRLQSKWGENEKNLSGGYSLCAGNCRKFASDKLFFLLGNDPQYEYISVQTLEDGWDCYIQLDVAEIDNYSSLLSMIVQTFLSGFLTRQNNPNAGRLPDGTLRPVLMCLDEFSKLATLKYEIVATAFMLLRSNNISIACALQSKSSISEMFHSENACMSLIDCVTTFCFLSIQEVQTREWASKLIGNRKVLRVSNSLNNGSNGNENTGRSVQETIEPIFQPADFGNLIDKNEGRDEIIVYSQGKYIKADKQYYFK